jgi:hypothetical protein
MLNMTIKPNLAQPSLSGKNSSQGISHDNLPGRHTPS